MKIRADWRFWSRWIKASCWLGWVQVNSTEYLLFSITAIQAILEWQAIFTAPLTLIAVLIKLSGNDNPHRRWIYESTV